MATVDYSIGFTQAEVEEILAAQKAELQKMGDAYSIAKEDARGAILQLFNTGSISPLNGQAVFEILNARGGAGLLDRLIADDYLNRGVHVLTSDKRMAKLPGIKLLG